MHLRKASASINPKAWAIAALLFCGAALVLSAAAQSAREVSIRGLQFRFPTEYVTLVSMAPRRNDVSDLELDIPFEKFGIDAGKWRRARVQLKLSYETHEASVRRALNAFGATAQRERLEQGMRVFTKPSYPSPAAAYWSTDVLYPDAADSQVYFICPHVQTTQDVLCEADTDYDSALTNPRIRLTFVVPRQRLGDWKDFESAVRRVLQSYRSTT